MIHDQKDDRADSSNYQPIEIHARDACKTEGVGKLSTEDRTDYSKQMSRIIPYQKYPTPEEIVIAALQKLDVPYELIDIDPRFADTAAFCDKYGYPAERSCNTIIVASKKEPKRYVACVVLAHTRLDVNKRVTKLMGVSKASFASAEEMIALTGMQVGGVTPFSLPSGVPLYVDDRIKVLD